MLNLFVNCGLIVATTTHAAFFLRARVLEFAQFVWGADWLSMNGAKSARDVSSEL